MTQPSEASEIARLRREHAVLAKANAKLIVALDQHERNQRALEATVAELQEAVLAIGRLAPVKAFHDVTLTRY